MTIFYISTSFGNKPNAASKAKNDVDEILKKKGFTPIFIKINNENKKSIINKIIFHVQYFSNNIKIFKTLKKGDTMIFQHPIQGGMEFYILLNILKKNQIKIVSVVHDLETFRKWDINYNSKRAKLNDLKILSKCDSIILHNKEMIKKFSDDTGIDSNKLVNLEIFDYLFNHDNNKKNMKDSYIKNVIIAGNLRREKAGYIYHLNEVDCQFTLYGMGFDPEVDFPNIEYKGTLAPDEIVKSIEGGFGLVWDGESISTCSGSTGEYLKVNNPHKTSLYLAAGIPVIVWDKAAISNFILDNKLGFTVSNLEEIPNKLKNIDDNQYSNMKKNCIQLSEKLSNGYFLNKAIDKILEK